MDWWSMRKQFEGSVVDGYSGKSVEGVVCKVMLRLFGSLQNVDREKA